MQGNDDKIFNYDADKSAQCLVVCTAVTHCYKNGIAPVNEPNLTENFEKMTKKSKFNQIIMKEENFHQRKKHSYGKDKPSEPVTSKPAVPGTRSGRRKLVFDLS